MGPANTISNAVFTRATTAGGRRCFIAISGIGFGLKQRLVRKLHSLLQSTSTRGRKLFMPTIRLCRFFPAWLLGAALFFGGVARAAEPTANSPQLNLYVVGYAHLDTQ